MGVTYDESQLDKIRPTANFSDREIRFGKVGTGNFGSRRPSASWRRLRQHIGKLKRHYSGYRDNRSAFDFYIIS